MTSDLRDEVHISNEQSSGGEGQAEAQEAAQLFLEGAQVEHGHHRLVAFCKAKPRHKAEAQVRAGAHLRAENNGWGEREAGGKGGRRGDTK